MQLQDSHDNYTAQSCGITCFETRIPCTHSHYRELDTLQECLSGLTDVELGWFKHKVTDPSCITEGHWQSGRYYNKTAHHHYVRYGEQLSSMIHAARPISWVADTLNSYFRKSDLRAISLLVSGDIQCPHNPVAVKPELVFTALDVDGMVEMDYDLPVWPTVSQGVTEECIEESFLPQTMISMNDVPAHGIIESFIENTSQGKLLYTMDCQSASHISDKPGEFYTYHVAAPDSNIVREATRFLEYESNYAAIAQKSYGVEIVVPTKVGRVGITSPYVSLAQRRFLVQMERRMLNFPLNVPLDSLQGILSARHEGEILMAFHQGVVHLHPDGTDVRRVCTCMTKVFSHQGMSPCFFHGFSYKKNGVKIGWRVSGDIQIVPTRFRTLATLTFTRKKEKNLVGYAYGQFLARLDATPMGRHPSMFPIIPPFYGFNIGYAGRTLSMSLSSAHGLLVLVMQNHTFASGFPCLLPAAISHVSGVPEDLIKLIFQYLLYFELFLPFIPVRSSSAGRWVSPYDGSLIFPTGRVPTWG